MSAMNEAAILTRVIGPDRATLPLPAAEALLALHFAPSDHARMAALSEKANEGVLTNDERDELEGYQRVGLFLDLMQSKARLSLKSPTPPYPPSSHQAA